MSMRVFGEHKTDDNMNAEEKRTVTPMKSVSVAGAVRVAKSCATLSGSSQYIFYDVSRTQHTAQF